MKEYVWLILFAFVLRSDSSTQSALINLTRVLESELSEFPAKTGLYAKDLNTGQETGVRADVTFNSASVIKLAVMGLAYNLADRKELNLDDYVEITRAHLRQGSWALQSQVGQRVSLRDLIADMITVSDNAAAEIMIAQVGGKDRVNQWLREAGFTQTTLQAESLVFTDLLKQLDPRWVNLSSEESTGLTLAINGDPLFDMYQPLFTGSKGDWISEAHWLSTLPNEKSKWKDWVGSRQHWFGSITPRDAGKFLEAIERGTLGSRENCEEMKALLLRQQLGGRRIPQLLPFRVGHKTGDVNPFVANDVGIVYAKSGPIVVSIFTAESTTLNGELDDRIARVSRLIVDSFEDIASQAAN